MKIADKRFNNLRHMYELSFTPGSIVRLVDDATVNDTIPDVHFEFIPLRDVSKHSHESFIGKKFIISPKFNILLPLLLKM